MIDAMDVGDGYPMDPPVAAWVPLDVQTMFGYRFGPQRSASLAATVPVRAAHRENRLQLLAAGLGGAVAALLIAWAVDRAG